MTTTMSRQPRVLMACPTWEGEQYALQKWADAYHAQTYPPELRGAFQVDNSNGPQHGGNLHYTHMVRGLGIECAWQQTRWPTFWDTMELAWRMIVEHAYDGDYDLILSVEADVILPPDGMLKMVNCAYQHGSADNIAVVTQRYHPRSQDGPNFWWDTLGCSLFPVEALFAERNLVKAIFEVDVFAACARRGYRRYRPGVDGPDLFIPEHLKDPQDPNPTDYGATPALSAYMRRVMEANGLTLTEVVEQNGHVTAAPPEGTGAHTVLDPPTAADFATPSLRAADALRGLGVTPPDPAIPPAHDTVERAKIPPPEPASRKAPPVPFGSVMTDEEARKLVSEDRIRLNIGCDRTQMGGFLGVDFNPEVNPDIVADATALPFEADTVDEIYASHVLEHLTWADGLVALKEWLRVLKPGGLLTAATPDILAVYYLWKSGARWGEYHMPIDDIYVQATAFGANLLADTIPEMKDLYGGPGHRHQSLYLLDMLLNRVIEAGFVYAHETQGCFLRARAIGETMVEAKKPLPGE